MKNTVLLRYIANAILWITLIVVIGLQLGKAQEPSSLLLLDPPTKLEHVQCPSQHYLIDKDAC